MLHICIALHCNRGLRAIKQKPTAVHGRHPISIWIERWNLCETNLRNVDLRTPSVEIGGATNKFEIRSFFSCDCCYARKMCIALAPWIALHSHSNRSVWLFHIELCLWFARSLAGPASDCVQQSEHLSFWNPETDNRAAKRNANLRWENTQTMLSPSLFAWFLHTVENELSILVSFSFSFFLLHARLPNQIQTTNLNELFKIARKRIKRIATKKCAQHFHTPIASK